METPPGPTRSPATMSTMPSRTAPRIRVTMPATTRIAAMTHKTVDDVIVTDFLSQVEQQLIA